MSKVRRMLRYEELLIHQAGHVLQSGSGHESQQNDLGQLIQTDSIVSFLFLMVFNSCMFASGIHPIMYKNLQSCDTQILESMAFADKRRVQLLKRRFLRMKDDRGLTVQGIGTIP